MPDKLSTRYKLGWQAIRRLLSRPRYLLLAALLYPPVLWLFTYLSNLNLFIYVMRANFLSGRDKIEFLLSSFTNVFANLNDPLALSIVIFAGFATLNLVMLSYAIKMNRRISGAKSSSAAALTLAGSHCIACGGSLLAPILTALSGSGAYISATRANTTVLLVVSINIIAILIIVHATLTLAQRSNVGLARAQ
ncbi:MAG: hypothetical protein WD467_01815 [Candidatus Saccharimonadales bacterium]